MKTLISSNKCIEDYRKLVDTYINLHVYSSAIFWADKVVALTNGNSKDVYKLAQCMYLSKEYHRAAHLLKSRNLDKTNILCNYLTVRCYLEANELNEALKAVNIFDSELFTPSHTTSTSTTSANTTNPQQLEAMVFDDVPKNQAYSSMLLLKAKVLEAMDNRGLATEYYKLALQTDVHCFEAFDSLVKYQMLTANEEKELLTSLPISSQCSLEEAQILLKLYECKLKKYHTPAGISENKPPSLAPTPKKDGGVVRLGTPHVGIPKLTVTVPISESTPNVLAENEKNSSGGVGAGRVRRGTKEPEEMSTEELSVPLSRLNNSLDMYVSQAERLYYNCDYQQCSSLTEAILKLDPYHSDCLPIHISCQVELKQTNQLFSLAHKLVDLYPNLAISWFAVGCYYYAIGKSDCTRRYLSKATCLDKLFGPAWLAYGHSFANENEHDQAMAAYFKATQLMKGCHLPLLYIGLECGLTNNVRLADKFFQQAQTIAPDDPFVLHEMGVIAFQNLEFKVAEKHFQSALSIVRRVKGSLLPERWGPLLNNLGHTCRKLKKYGEALEYHHQALLLSPQSASTYSAIAYVHVLMGHTDEGVNWFHKALGLKRDDTFSTTMLNYVIEQLCEEKPAYPDAPTEIPNFTTDKKGVDLQESSEQGMIEDESMIQSRPSELSGMSVEMEMSDFGEGIKE